MLQSVGITDADWETRDVDDDPNGVRVVALRSRDRGEDAVLKLAKGPRALAALGSEVQALTSAREVGPNDLVETLPRFIDGGNQGIGPDRTLWMLDGRRPGVDARTLITDDRLGAVMTADLVARITGLHRATVTSVSIGDDLPELLDLPLAVTDSLPTSRMRVRADETSLARLQTELRADLAGTHRHGRVRARQPLARQRRLLRIRRHRDRHLQLGAQSPGSARDRAHAPGLHHPRARSSSASSVPWCATCSARAASATRRRS